MSVINTHSFGRFWPVSWSITQCYGEPWGAFMCRSSTLAVFSNSDKFRGLLLTVWGLEAISIVVEAQGALTCRSSTVIVLTDSGPFRGLLLTVLGSRSDFHN